METIIHSHGHTPLRNRKIPTLLKLFLPDHPSLLFTLQKSTIVNFVFIMSLFFSTLLANMCSYTYCLTLFLNFSTNGTISYVFFWLAFLIQHYGRLPHANLYSCYSSSLLYHMHCRHMPQLIISPIWWTCGLFPGFGYYSFTTNILLVVSWQAFVRVYPECIPRRKKNFKIRIRWAKHFCQVPENKYFRLCRPCGFCYSYSNLSF